MGAVFAVGRGAFDLVKVRKFMGPELGVPGAVERGDVAVLFPQPVAERLLAQRAVAFAAVFVGEVPEDDAGVAPEAARKRLVDLLHLLAVDGRGVAVVMARAEELARAVGVDAHHLGILLREPRGPCAAGRGEIDGDSGGIEAVDDLLHPVEVVAPFLGLQRAPGEDAQRDDVDVRLLHELDVPREDVGAVKPLVGVVVRAVVKGRHGNDAPFG